MKVKLALLIFLLLTGYPVRAQDKKAQDYFDQAGQKYIEGNGESAVADFEKGLVLDKDNKEIKDIFAECLKGLIFKFYKEGSYEKANFYLEKLLKLSPEDKEYQKMYEELRLRLAPGQKSLPGIPSSPVQSPPATKVVSEPAPSKKTSVPDKEWLSLLKSQLEKQEQLFKNYEGAQKELVKKILERSTKEKEELLVQMQVREKELLKKLQEGKTGISAFIKGILVTVLFLVLAALILVRYIRKKSAVIVLHGNKQMAEGIPVKVGEMMTPVHKKTSPSGGLDQLRLIAVEVVKEADPRVAETALHPFLNSEDSQVKAEACQYLFKHNPNTAFITLREMVESNDGNKKINAFRVLGNLDSGEGVNLLLAHAAEPDYKMKREVVKSLQKVMEEKSAGLSPELKMRVEKVLSGLKNKGTWVME